MSEENRPSDSVPGDESVTPSGGDEKVSEGLSLEELNKTLGRDYPSKAEALKAIKETYNFVGKPRSRPTEQAAPQSHAQPEAHDDATVERLASVERRLAESEFYRTNPDLEPYRNEIAELAGGRPLEQLAQSEAFKTFISKAKAHDEAEKSKSVLSSSPRLGQARDRVSKSREALAKNDMPTAQHEAVGAVIEAFDMTSKR